MIWQNGWAFAGLLALLLPVLIHLLSRKRAVLHKFPSLRFLNVSRLLPTRSPHLSDIPLLLVRLAVFAAAVLALAQPVWLSAGRTRALNARMARVIVLDTSRSMQRPRSNGRSAIDSARSAGQQLAEGAAASVTLQTAFPARAIDGAVRWLDGQGSRGEVVILSDFQALTVDSATVARVPHAYGVRLVRIGGSGPATTDATGPAFRTTAASVTVTTDSARTTAEWTSLASASPAGESPVVLSAAAADQATAELVQRATQQAVPAPRADATRPVTVVYPGAPAAAALRGAARAPTVAWISEIMLHVRANAVLQGAAAGEALPDTTIGSPFVVLARNQQDVPVVFSAEAAANGRERLVLFQRAPAGSLTAAALLAAVNAAVATETHLSETEPTFAGAAALERLEREPATVAAAGAAVSARAAADLSDGRWFWVLALLLLGVETFMRRSATSAIAREAV